MDGEELRVMIGELNAAQARMEERVNALSKNLDEHKTLTDSVWELALSVRDLTNQQRQTTDTVKQLRADVDEIQRRPARRWDAAQMALISSLMSGAIGYLLARLF